MMLKRLRHRLPLRLVLALVVLALAASPLAATVMPPEDSGVAIVDPVSPHDGQGPCHGSAPPATEVDDAPCPHCGNPLHALCTCCPCAAAFAIEVANVTVPTPFHSRAPAALGRVAALPRNPGERRFRPPIAHR
jgi:hypothetical protein